MSRYPEFVYIRDMTTRDGFQMEHSFIPTEEKIKVINMISHTGIPEQQYTAFMHPKAIPALTDAEAVVAGIERVPGVCYSTLVGNKRGLDRAVAAGVKKTEFVISVTDSHNISNANCTTAESLKRLEECVSLGYDITITPSAAVSFGCPFEGKVPYERIEWVVSHYVDFGLDELCISDSSGTGDPKLVYETFSRLKSKWPEKTFVFHGHNTKGMGMANVLAALEGGATIIDTCCAGLGGCPFLPGASGNLATEDVVQMLELMGIKTNIDLDKTIEAARYIANLVGHHDSVILRAGKVSDLPGIELKRQAR